MIVDLVEGVHCPLKLLGQSLLLLVGTKTLAPTDDLRYPLKVLRPDSNGHVVHLGRASGFGHLSRERHEEELEVDGEDLQLAHLLQHFDVFCILVLVVVNDVL